MARKRLARLRSYFEPWEALQSLAVRETPNVEGFTEEQAQSVLEHHARSNRDSPWYIWGTGMVEPARVHLPMSGSHAMTSGRQIIAIRKVTSDKEDAPTAEEMTKRIAECVNALAGIADPATFVSDVRALLYEYTLCNRLDPTEDSRFASLLSRCIPPESLEQAT